MKILIIEDSQFKSVKIIEYLNSFGINEICVKESYHSALKEVLSGNRYDLILLDISIPQFDKNAGSSDFLPSGGKYLLNQIYMNDVDTKVIVVTLYRQFDDGENMENLNFQFINDYPDLYLGYILFNIDNFNWQLDLHNKLKLIL